MVDGENTRTFAGALAAVVGVVLVAVACGGPQRIRHYHPEVPKDAVKARSTKSAPDLTIAVEDFSAGAAYDEQRIVYRAENYRIDYYHFHRWGAPPGMIVGETLRDVYRKSGAFESVVGAYTTRADVVLSGRVLALEEVDVNKKKWVGHVALDLRLRDAATGELLWTEIVEKRKPLAEQSPKGLARAVSEALTEIGLESVDAIARNGQEAVRKRRREEREQSSGPGSGASGPSGGTTGGDETSSPANSGGPESR